MIRAVLVAVCASFLCACTQMQVTRLKAASRQMALAEEAQRGRAPSDGKPTPGATKKYWDAAATRPKSEREYLRDADGRETKHGFERRWYENGHMQYERQFERGEPTGTWRSWFASGQLESEATYVEGVPMPMRWWYASGILASEGMTLSGSREGPWRTWHENGQLASQGALSAGRRHGPWEYFRPDGSLDSRGEYDRGAKSGTWEYAPKLAPTRESSTPSPGGDG